MERKRFFAKGYVHITNSKQRKHPEEELVAEQSEWVDVFERMILMARLSPPLRERHGD